MKFSNSDIIGVETIQKVTDFLWKEMEYEIIKISYSLIEKKRGARSIGHIYAQLATIMKHDPSRSIKTDLEIILVQREIGSHKLWEPDPDEIILVSTQATTVELGWKNERIAFYNQFAKCKFDSAFPAPHSAKVYA